MKYTAVFLCILIFANVAAPGVSNDVNIFVNLAKKVVPSVVNISTLSSVKSPYRQGNPDDLFRKFFEDNMRNHGGEEGGENPDSENEPNKNSQAPKAMSLGTGFIIDASGLILTNNHVVAQADEIKVSFTEDSDETPTEGSVVGRDLELDLAILKVKTKRKLVPVTLGDSDSLEVGEYVMAVGNPFGQGHSVSHGIISAKGRVTPDFKLASYLQTDAPINPGNSGGPLVNLKGEVIGINNAIDARAQGIGFAIPINSVKSVLSELKSKGSVTRGYIGILVGELTPEMSNQLSLSKTVRGPMITHVYPNGPAEQAGIKPYDVIIEINSKSIKKGEDLIREVTSIEVGKVVPIKVNRKGSDLALSIKIAERPSQMSPNKMPPEKKIKSKINLGMELEDITPEISKELGIKGEPAGVLISGISFGGPADKSGLARGDIIIEVDQKKTDSVDQFNSIVNSKKTYMLRIRRVDVRGSDSFTVVMLNLKKA